MPIAMYGETLADELMRARDIAQARALEQRLEADTADAIASRDEKIVAGEDAERAAHAAAELARTELGGAAGLGAAGIAGMAAAQKARAADFAGLLQRARDRKDMFEQKGVDRRANAFDTEGQASGLQQLRLRDQQLASLIKSLQAERDNLQRAAMKQSRTNKESDVETQRKIDQAAQQKIESEDVTPQTFPPDAKEEGDLSAVKAYKETLGRLQTQFPDIDLRAISRPVHQIAFVRDPKMSEYLPESVTSDAGKTFYKQSTTIISQYLLWYPWWYDNKATPEERSKYINYAEAPAIWDKEGKVVSDSRLKYRGMGNHAGKAGNAESNAALYKKKAEEMFDGSDGLNEVLIERYKR